MLPRFHTRRKKDHCWTDSSHISNADRDWGNIFPRFDALRDQILIH